MITGIFCGLTAAFLNSVGYLFSAFFLRKCNSPVRLLIYAQIWMMLLSLPVISLLYPAGGVVRPARLFWTLAVWIIVFFVGQGAFFTALKFFEASRLSSLLGLKIIVLTVIYTVVNRVFPNFWQYVAVLMAAVAAVTINWSGGGGMKTKGWIFVFITLICYSLADMTETVMVLCFVDSGLGTVRSAFTATSLSYTALGLASLPGLLIFKPDRKFFPLSAPYALIWLLSQAALLSCFALVLPVFGNVILASRGMFSVILGALAAAVGLKGIEARISRAQWIRRGFAALLMVLAIAVYSFASRA